MKKTITIAIAGLFAVSAAMTSFAAGWQGRTGAWRYEKADGIWAVNEWVQEKGSWYYIKADGIMATGWYQDQNQVWYYLKADGVMASGEWITDNGTDYYIGTSGAWEDDTGYLSGPVEITQDEELQ